jgi:hypothetical protein
VVVKGTQNSFPAETQRTAEEAQRKSQITTSSICVVYSG